MATVFQKVAAAAQTISGAWTFTTATVTGSVDGTVGATTPAAGVFTTAQANTSLKVAAAGTPLTQIVVYSQVIAPASVAAQIVVEQTFTVTGLTTADKVFVNPGAILNAVGIAGVRVSAANTLAVLFVNPTIGALTPTSTTWSIVAIRS